ncbi:MAG: hypothetical protein FJZ01_27625 [Candidatus Sericytochromatia bacterium]|nr:hypothetical protein [Candidatus Tanganyikabacteria bacterium]
MQALAGARLLGLALPDVVWPKGEAWSATRGVELSRQADFALAEVAADEEAWRRLQNDLYSRFREFEDELMRRGIVATGSPQGDLFLVSVSFQNSDMGVDEARSALIAEINARHAVLSASEKRVIENHLLGEVAAQIGDRLHQAESMVERMNREVAHCQTTAGMILKFRWLIGEEAPVGIKDARALLMRTGTMRSPQEQEALASFLQGRISAERSQGDAGSWYQILARALDYRSWHEFQVERQQDGKWVRLTKRTHGTGSGGEKAIALTVPQFAAAAAHYSSADEIAPRLILLDEAFVGVDKQVRSRAMGLLAAFDLDFVMTSENEWGCYPTLPHVAIYQLSGKAGIDAVGTTRFVWNGRERRRADVLPPPATASIIGRSGGREGDGGDEVPPAPQLGLDFGALPASSSER